MQLLLGIEIPEKIKNEINIQLQDIKKLYPQFQWIQNNKYQILVQSFGSSFDSKKVVKRLEEILYDKKSFFFYSHSVRMAIQDNITLYLGFRREKEIEKINDQVREEFQVLENGLKFIPRVVLANYKIPSKQQYFVIKKRIAKLIVDVSFKVNKLSLFEDSKKIRSYKLL